ncbi:hypothetical protein [Streptomyces sp. NBC_00454]|uniref:hypothetical protein n=1 Tax=Streptomyces sp. NBC_00454 TaxID=2975747 RepID=UPI0030DF14B4
MTVQGEFAAVLTRTFARGGTVVIVSSAGTATGGRVLHHLRLVLPDPRNAVAHADAGQILD